jgi:transketolase
MVTSPVLYSVLAHAGYFPWRTNIPPSLTLGYRDTRLTRDSDHSAIASGSLGQGMSVGIGAALTKKA